jgi:hypothetical protein
MTMSQPGFWWQRYGTAAQAAVALFGACGVATQWTMTSQKTASVTPPDCKLGKT